MATANTFEVDKISGYTGKKDCAICGELSAYRTFFYPTYMNGDAEWCGDYCEKHKPTEKELIKICKGITPIRYKID